MDLFVTCYKTGEPYLKLPCLRDSIRHKYQAREKDSNRQVGPDMGQDESLLDNKMHWIIFQTLKKQRSFESAMHDVTTYGHRKSGGS